MRTKRLDPPIEMTPIDSSCGALRVSFKLKGVETQPWIDVLVLQLFSGHYFGTIPVHLDGDILNSAFENLQWGDQPIEERVRPRFKLNKVTIVEIRKALETTETHKSIAKRFGVSPVAISHIQTGEAWSHVPGAQTKTRPNLFYKLNLDLARTIRKELDAGKTLADLARKYDIYPTTISDIKYNKTWKEPE